MSRILLLLVYGLWMTAVGGTSQTAMSRRDLAIFLGGYAAALLVMIFWARLTAGRVAAGNLSLSLSRFNRGMWFARLFVPGWFAVGLFVLHWPAAVSTILGPVAHWPVDSPGALLGTLPAVLAWVALICTQFPAERALREQSVLIQLEDDRPVHIPPGMWSYVAANLRLEVMFTVVPVGMILVLHDAGALALWFSGHPKRGSEAMEWVDPLLSLASAGVVFLLAPAVLRHVLHTRPLADSPLRQRLEAMCKRVGLRYRDILLWHTDNHMGNAAVMGVVPFVRYILLSDLLLETMSDRQIEAVFAHELGHVVHRHLTWSGLFIVVLMLAAIGPGKWVDDHFSTHLPSWAADVVLPGLATLAGLMLLFGVLSRFFERQADVYAARTMEWSNQTTGAQIGAQTGEQIVPVAVASPAGAHVGEYGARVFSSALYRVAIINNIPVASRTLTHGSIADRIEYLRQMSGDPARTGDFDRFMVGVYISLISVLVICAGWSAMVVLRP